MMRARLDVLRHLMAVYAAVEDMHSTELKQTAEAVRGTQIAMRLERDAMSLARVIGRDVLVSGHWESWVMATNQEEVAGWRWREFEQIRLQREQLADAAREQYIASRLKKEQIARLCEDVEARMELERGRRTQCASDDQFLARRRWSDGCKEKNAK